MRKTLTLIVLLFTSQFANAITQTELTCVARSVYFEGRSLTELEQRQIANVILNRSELHSKWHFNAKSPHLCDIVKSKEFHSHVTHKLHEQNAYANILRMLQAKRWDNLTNAQYFTTKRNKLRLETKSIK